MPRLFLAIGLPPEPSAVLVRIQPSATPGLLLVAPDQMHLTLHFIGEAGIESVADMVAGVQAPAFTLKLCGVGRFRGGVLWAGVEPNAALLQLHALLRDALQHHGYAVEARAYTPHITLARSSPAAPGAVVEDFLAQHAAFAGPAFKVDSFGLYSSTLIHHIPYYRLERSFALAV